MQNSNYTQGEATTSELFKKHFGVAGEMGTAGIFQPAFENFFEELNQQCLREDAAKLLNQLNTKP